MKFGLRRKPDPVAQEVTEQSARSKAVLNRVERALGKAVDIIEDYRVAETERLRMRQK